MFSAAGQTISNMLVSRSAACLCTSRLSDFYSLSSRFLGAPQNATCSCSRIVPRWLAQCQIPSERPWLSSPEETAVARNPEIVREMFDRVARRYDLANHLLSFGCDFSWRRRAAEIVGDWEPACVLDLATGSGDLALVL